MHGENLLVDDCCNGQAVEAIGKGLPELDVVPSLALVIEAVDSVDRSALMVAAQDEEVFGVFYLVGQEEADRLKRLLASVDIVAEEEVVGLRWEAPILEQPEEVVVLAMNITTNLSCTHARVSCDFLRGGAHQARRGRCSPLSAPPTLTGWAAR